MLDIHVASVAEFLRAVLPTESHFSADSWYFRGQGNAAWGLVPSMRRENAWESLGGVRHFGLRVERGLVISSEDELKLQEERILSVLAGAIESLGLPTELREADVVRAYAQHIGLPTRLLDWTRSPLIAAYFAAADAVQLGSCERLCVFAVSPHYLKHSRRLRHVERLRVPAYGNPNLVAQQGVLFKIDGEPFDLVSGLDRRSIQPGTLLPPEEAKLLDNHLLAVTLPGEQAANLLRALRAQGVHAGTIYPGQTGIAELVREVLRTEPPTSRQLIDDDSSAP